MKKILFVCSIVLFTACGGQDYQDNGGDNPDPRAESSLDLAFQLETAALLLRLNRDHRTTAVVCTHDLNFAAGVCHDLVLLREGRILAAGPTETVLTPETIGAVYGVDADVHRHPVSHQLTVVPLARRA